MFFKKKFFLLLGFFFLSSCVLKIGEEAPPIPKYRMAPDSGYCSKLNYKEEFISYFLKAEEEPLEVSKGERLRKALSCLGSVILKNKKLFKNEYLERQELINLLNQDFIRTDNVQPIIDHITNPDYFDNYIFFKDNIVYLLEQVQSGQTVSVDKVCQSRKKDEIVFSKKDVSVFLIFLENLEELFLKIDKDSHEIFDSFFKTASSDPYLFSKSKLEQSLVFKEGFLPFLSGYMKAGFPEYSEYLDDKFSEINYDFSQLKGKHNMSYGEQYALRKLFQVRDDILDPLFIMAKWPPSESDKLDVQSVKYILLNIYITKALFAIYDADKNFLLSPEELEPLSCLIKPLVSVVISPKLKDQWEIVQSFYNPKAIAGYIMMHQKIPSRRFEFSFHWYLVSGGHLEELSYIEISRLISTLFATFFDREFIELIDEIKSVENL